MADQPKMRLVPLQLADDSGNSLRLEIVDSNPDGFAVYAHMRSSPEGVVFCLELRELCLLADWLRANGVAATPEGHRPIWLDSYAITC